MFLTDTDIYKFDNLGQLLWDFIISILKFTDKLWTFFIQKRSLSIPYTSSPAIIEVGGVKISLNIIDWLVLAFNKTLGSFEFRFITIFSGTFILTLMVFYLIKLFVPVL